MEKFHTQAFDWLKDTNVKHADETSMRVGGKTHWMHVLSNILVTYLRSHPRRKTELEEVRGTLVHDHYSSYGKYANVKHAFCNAHHLRELKALVVHEKEDWANELHTLLQIMGRLKHEEQIGLKQAHRFRQIFDKILNRGIACHEAMPV